MVTAPGTYVAYRGKRGVKMDSISTETIARVGAVLLLVGLVWASSVMGGGDNRRGYSDARTQTKTRTGVGTESGPREGDSKVREESPKSGKASRAGEILGAPGSALTVFREVESGWRSATPKPFEKYFRKGKVRLDFGEGGPRGGLFARSQAYYLLGDYLKGTQTLEIGFSKISTGPTSGAGPHALLERSYRDRNGVSRREVIVISLSQEDSVWAISEVRVIPAK
jgi:hypothetical protein